MSARTIPNFDHVAENPTTRDAELGRLFEEWNATQADYPRTSCLHHLVEQQVHKTPRKIAAEFEGKQTTWEELNANANRIARHLIDLGLRTETMVGISLDRSLAMVAALLGVLKAGGAYVPLDPAYPKDRLAFMIEDAKIQFLISEKRLRTDLQARVAQVVWLDSDWQSISKQDQANLKTDAGPENLAYVIYTSGSSGRPKGVQVLHRAVVNFLTSMRRRPGLADDDVLLALTTLSFDIAALEIFLPLATGARLVIASREVASDGVRLAAEIGRSGATVLQATPASWRMLLSAGWRGDGKLRMLCGGEPLSADLAKQLLARGGRLWNMYGPTETTIWSTVHEVKSDDSGILIGRPIDNTQVYLLDKQLRPVPQGTAAELYIGGDGLARGYLNRSELTAERFIRNPFTADLNARLYKTGDLARYQEDGTLECLGRLDHQIKIRGFRIEAGDVEAVIRSHPDVVEAVVTAVQFGPDDKRLVAYLVLNNASPGSLMISGLRSFLAERLPDYMLPAAFIVLERIPLTPSGKVDRNSLPSPREAPPLRRESLIIPLDPLEHQLTEIWEDIFQLSPVGIRDNFFDLGGDSLLAARMMERVEQACGRRLAVDALYKLATIEHLASELMQQEGPPLQSPIVEVQAGRRKLPFFFLHGDFNGGGFYCRKLAGLLGEDQPFYALPPMGADGGKVPATIEEMAELHLQALRAFYPGGPYLLGGFCNGALVAFEMARRLLSEGREVRFLAVTYASAVNARYRSLERLLRISAALAGLSKEQNIDSFIRLRRCAMKFREAREYYRGRLAESMQKDIHEKAATIMRAPGGLKRLVKTLFDSSPSGADETAPRAAAPTEEPEELAASRRTAARRKLTDSYNRIMDCYVPQTYDSRLTLFWPDEAPAEEFNDPTMGWRKVASVVDVRAIRGAHLTCITRHVEVLAQQLRECLQHAQSGRGLQ